ncbi:uncharacterized protein LOC127440470 isoform X4 [Myxocyprinus asiaticus]|uniref:uncharacterized protein LOC127440470 isoform X3 n=1 Tax=Myxocyprinus asiaticus TaxID=70543 RepID=UPI00222354A0|nr:uncharacterized protein LOC127440470 isoform X3 [Myxocyprinus asiaticus]XP_051553035.1 uncharacterized protein LOC127440470 isoform X4 [Myxocyprinus asiaticus]
MDVTSGCFLLTAQYITPFSPSPQTLNPWWRMGLSCGVLPKGDGLLHIQNPSRTSLKAINRGLLSCCRCFRHYSLRQKWGLESLCFLAIGGFDRCPSTVRISDFCVDLCLTLPRAPVDGE